MQPKSLNFKRKSIPNGDGKGPGDYITAIMQIYDNFTNDQKYTVNNPDDGTVTVTVSKIFPNEHFAYYKITIDRPLRLNFCINSERIEQVKQETEFKALAMSKKKSNTERLIEIENGQKRQEAIINFLKMFSEINGGQLYKDRKVFLTELRNFDKEKDIKLNAAELKAILIGLSEPDETAEMCMLPNGKFEADPMLADTEYVPVTSKIYGYKSLIDKKKSGFVDNIPLNDKEKDTIKLIIDEYVKNEVLPHIPDARVDYKKTKIGYEIPLTREFYVYQPPRALDIINAEIIALEKEISEML
jgi:type I restriction enzyme M protein